MSSDKRYVKVEHVFEGLKNSYGEVTFKWGAPVSKDGIVRVPYIVLDGEREAIRHVPYVQGEYVEVW